MLPSLPLPFPSTFSVLEKKKKTAYMVAAIWMLRKSMMCSTLGKLFSFGLHLLFWSKCRIHSVETYTHLNMHLLQINVMHVSFLLPLLLLGNTTKQNIAEETAHGPALDHISVLANILRVNKPFYHFVLFGSGSC